MRRLVLGSLAVLLARGCLDSANGRKSGKDIDVSIKCFNGP